MTAPTSGLREPVPRALARGLRSLVFEMAGTGRTAVAPTLSIGVPGELRTTLDLAGLPSHVDDALRVELVATLLRHAQRYSSEPVCWLTRPGQANWHDLDAQWLSPAATAYAEAEVPLTWVVITRAGWWDPRTDVARSWVRPRRRGGP